MFHRRLLDKQQRVEAIAASLEQNGADPSQKEEVEEMITPPEKAQLAKIKHMTNKSVYVEHITTEKKLQTGIVFIANFRIYQGVSRDHFTIYSL